MTPKERKNKLSELSLNQASINHDWLKKCFLEELDWRLDKAPAEDYLEDDDYFENIYHCATFLFYIKDLPDIDLFYSAKRSGDMDLGVGFDWQFLFMDIPGKLIKYLITIDRKDIVDWIKSYQEDYEEEDMSDWFEFKCEYHDINKT